MDRRSYEMRAVPPTAVPQPVRADSTGLYEQYYSTLSQPLPEASPARKSWFTLERVLLLLSMVVGAITHGYHLFLYPLYIKIGRAHV